MEKDKKIILDFLELINKKASELEKNEQNILLNKIKSKIEYCEKEIKDNEIDTMEKIYFENVIKAYKELIY